MWAKLKHQIWEWRGVLVAAPSVTGLIILLRLLGWLQPLDWLAFDYFLHLLPPESVDPRIVIVSIDETDINQLKQWPIGDDVLAETLDRIKHQQPRSIGLDIVRDLPTEPGHQRLVELFKSTPNLVGALQTQLDPKSTPKNLLQRDALSGIAPSPVLKELGQLGEASLIVDGDGTVRRALLSLENSERETVLGFGFKLALLYLNDEHKEIPYPEAINPPRFQANDGGYVNADVGGHQVLLNYRRAEAGFRSVSLRDVLANRIPSDLFRDRVVLIGVTAVSLKDYFTTPLNKLSWNSLTQTSGVEIHAHIISQLLSATLDGRTETQVWSSPVAGLWVFVWSLLGAVLSWKWRHVGLKIEPQNDRDRGKKRSLLKSIVDRLNSLTHPLVFFVVGGALIIACYFALWAGWWIPVVPPLLALAGSGLAIVIYIARSAAEIRTFFSRYLSDEIVAMLLETPEGTKIGSARRKVTILMCDLRGFSSISEQLSPESVVAILNVFLGEMTSVISQYQGTIDEFIGDAILVIFGAPIFRDDDAYRAVACSIAMQLRMDMVNAQLEQLSLPIIAMGIGLNTGEVVVGNIGSQTRTKYAVVGSNVNLTSRIESFTVGGQILISDATLADAGEEIVQVNRKMIVEPKGVKHPIAIYDVGGIGGKYNLLLTKKEDVIHPLRETILLSYKVLEDKSLDSHVYHGRLIGLSLSGAEISADRSLPFFTNIKIFLLPIPVSNPEGIHEDPDKDIEDQGFYAKVTERDVGENATFYVCFTTMPTTVKNLIEQIIARQLEEKF